MEIDQPINKATKVGAIDKIVDSIFEGCIVAKRYWNVSQNAIGNQNTDNCQDAFKHVFVFERLQNRLEIHVTSCLLLILS